MAAPSIHHVHADFFALISEGAGGDLSAFRGAIDQLLEQMGDPRFHPLLLDLRAAVLRPLPPVLLIQAMAYLSDKGLGRKNKVALIVNRDDQERTDRAVTIARIAQAMEMTVQSFADYAAALDWLTDKAPPPLQDARPATAG
jgi:hypothetical protein